MIKAQETQHPAVWTPGRGDHEPDLVWSATGKESVKGILQAGAATLPLPGWSIHL